VLEAGFGVGVLVRRLRQQQLPFEPIQLRLIPALRMVVRHHERLCQQAQPFLCLRCVPTRVSQKGQKIRHEQLCPRRAYGRETLAHLCQSLRCLPLRGQRPAAQRGRPRQVEGKPLLHTEGDQGLGPFLPGPSLPAELMAYGNHVQGMHQCEGVCQLLRPDEYRLILLAGLLRIAQYPQAMGYIEATIHTGVDPVEKERAAMRLGVIQGEPLLRVRVGVRILTLPAEGDGQSLMGGQELGVVVPTLGQT